MDRLWEIMEDVEAGALTVYRTNGFAADSEGPTLYTREEFEEFISALRNAASRIWPDDEWQLVVEAARLGAGNLGTPERQLQALQAVERLGG